MIETSPSADFEARAESFGTGLAGTIGVQILDNVGGVALARTTAGIVEDPAGSGSYIVTLPAPATAGQYEVAWDDGSGLWAFEDLDVEAIDVAATVAAIRARTDLIGAVTIVSAPVTSNDSITLVAGDDYAAADGRALEWTDDGDTWPDLTAATVTLGLKADRSGTAVTYSGSVVVATGAGKQVRVELAAADTTGLEVGKHWYDLEVTLDSGRTVTLARGRCTVSQDFTPPVP